MVCRWWDHGRAGADRQRRALPVTTVARDLDQGWHLSQAHAGYRPQTNGKVERLHRTMLDEWACARSYASEAERLTCLPDWLHQYNHHRAHAAIGGRPPVSRVPN